MLSVRAGMCVMVALAVTQRPLAAQPVGQQKQIVGVMFGNILIGGFTAAVRAALEKEDAARATFSAHWVALCTVSGRAAGPITVSRILQTFQHEAVHVQQGWYLQEAWGWPLEEASRARVHILRWIPKWVELGVLSPGLLEVENIVFGLHGPMRRWREAEAESLQGTGGRRSDAGISAQRGSGATSRRYLR